MRRILAICTSHIGGVLLITPALELLRHFFSSAEISVLVRLGTEPMLQNNPAVKHIYTSGEITSNQQLSGRTKSSLWRRLRQIPRGLKLLRTLRRERFDLAVDFAGSDRAAIFAFFSGARERAGYELNGGFPGKRRLFTRLFPRPPGRQHKVLKNAELVFQIAATRQLGSEANRPAVGPLSLNPLPHDLSQAETEWQNLAAGDRPRVVLHPASRVRFKSWAPARWAQVVERAQTELNACVLLTCSSDPAEIAIVRTIVDLCPVKPPARAGGISLSQLAALIQRADLFLGVDSAPMHMAAAVGTPVVAVFGPSRDEEWGPWGDGHRVIRRPCPCADLQQPRCSPEGGVDCLNALTVDEVFNGLKESLGKTPRQARPAAPTR